MIWYLIKYNLIFFTIKKITVYFIQNVRYFIYKVIATLKKQQYDQFLQKNYIKSV